jgi:hypothetical protein
MMTDPEEIINHQIESNKGKNLFLVDSEAAFKFIEETVKAIEGIDNINGDYEKLLVDYASEKAFQEFCRVNQYFSFAKNTRNELKDIYRELFSNIRAGSTGIDEISKIHYRNLKSWLQKNNPFAGDVYSKEEKILTPVACSEYSADFQIRVLRLDLGNILVPVLDIGSGIDGALVRHLSLSGIEAHGIDRFHNKNPDIEVADWLDYDYGMQKWGTITSNLGFSNHFNHHHLREDGEFSAYAKKYMDILNSLKIGGSFHYGPGLPFIEKYLDKEKFVISIHRIGKLNFNTSVVTRLK